VKCKGFRKNFTGKVKTVTVSFVANQYHASVLIDDFQEQILGNNNGKALGIDVGVKLVVADSNGKRVLPLKL
jgi:transposase